MTVFIGGDHRGFALKQTLKDFLQSKGHDVVDVGTHTRESSCDYPPISREVATHVAKIPGSRGILLCLTGIGHSIAANKVPGAYAALVYNKEAAALSRQHNNSNILVLGAKFTAEKDMLEIIQIWLQEEFEGGRHGRRVEQIKQMEDEFMRKVNQ